MSVCLGKSIVVRRGREEGRTRLKKSREPRLGNRNENDLQGQFYSGWVTVGNKVTGRRSSNRPWRRPTTTSTHCVYDGFSYVESRDLRWPQSPLLWHDLRFHQFMGYGSPFLTEWKQHQILGKPKVTESARTFFYRISQMSLPSGERSRVPVNRTLLYSLFVVEHNFKWDERLPTLWNNRFELYVQREKGVVP